MIWQHFIFPTKMLGSQSCHFMFFTQMPRVFRNWMFFKMRIRQYFIFSAKMLGSRSWYSVFFGQMPWLFRDTICSMIFLSSVSRFWFIDDVFSVVFFISTITAINFRVKTKWSWAIVWSTWKTMLTLIIRITISFIFSTRSYSCTKIFISKGCLITAINFWVKTEWSWTIVWSTNKTILTFTIRITISFIFFTRNSRRTKIFISKSWGITTINYRVKTEWSWAIIRSTNKAILTLIMRITITLIFRTSVTMTESNFSIGYMVRFN